MVKAITSPRDVKYWWREDRAAYEFDFRPFGAGRPHYKSKTEGLNKAKELIEAMRCKVSPGATFEVREPWTLGEAFEHFKDHYQRRVDDPDARFGAARLSNLKDLLKPILTAKQDGVAVAKIKVEDLTKEYVERTLWPKVIKKSCGIRYAKDRLSAFRSLLEYCCNESQCRSNVAKQATIEAPSQDELWAANMDKAIAKVAPETLQTILDHCEDEVEKLKLIFAANTGMRVGEQVAVLIYDVARHEAGGIDFENNLVHVRIARKRGKSRSEDFIGAPKSQAGIRSIPITPELSATLKTYYEGLSDQEKSEGWLFPTSHGTMSCGRNWRVRILYEACRKAKLPRKVWPTWHMLRHAYATAFLAEEGKDWPRAMELMGHKHMSTTLLYKKHVEDKKRDTRNASSVANRQGLKLPQIGNDQSPDPHNVVAVAR